VVRADGGGYHDGYPLPAPKVAQKPFQIIRITAGAVLACINAFAARYAFIRGDIDDYIAVISMRHDICRFYGTVADTAITSHAQVCITKH